MTTEGGEGGPAPEAAVAIPPGIMTTPYSGVVISAGNACCDPSRDHDDAITERVAAGMAFLLRSLQGS